MYLQEVSWPVINTLKDVSHRQTLCGQHRTLESEFQQHFSGMLVRTTNVSLNYFLFAKNV